MVLFSGSWLKRGMVYHDPVLLFIVEERNGLPFCPPDSFLEERTGLAWYEERDGFPMVLSPGSFMKKGMVSLWFCPLVHV
jgi:hypothetical protein